MTGPENCSTKKNRYVRESETVAKSEGACYQHRLVDELMVRRRQCGF